ncbi:MAG: gliding motility-associated C-terminal domain-containing protein, partial [Bacteroidota bacterium]
DGWIGLYDPEGWPVNIICWGDEIQHYNDPVDVTFDCIGHMILLPPSDFAVSEFIDHDFEDTEIGGLKRKFDGSDEWVVEHNDFTPRACNSVCLDIPETNFSVTNARCKASDGSIFVEFTDSISLPYIYKWEHEMTDWHNFIDNLPSGEYILHIRNLNGECISRYDTVFLGMDTPDFVIESNIVNDECHTSSGQIYVTDISNAIPPLVYQWSNSVDDTLSMLGEIGEAVYSVTITDRDSCSDFTSFAVGNSCIVSAPNTFTPNGDGINDTWIFRNLDFFPENLLEIYNRNGHLVYSAMNYKNDWTGSTNDNKPLPEATYYYTMTLYTEAGFMKGSITIIR